MKFNTKTRYGVRVMLELALNDHKEGGTLQKDIAESQDVSIKYLDHIVASLKKAGLIANVAGKKSGYVLTRSPKKISVFDVFSAFESDLAIIDCLMPDGKCPRMGFCVMKDYWCELNESIRNSMTSMNLEILAQKHHKKIP